MSATCRVILAAAFAAGLIACSRHDPPSLNERAQASIKTQSSEAEQRGHSELARVLRDGVLTDAEVDSMHSLYRECMARTGAVLSPAHRSPIDGRTYFEWETNIDEMTAASNGPVEDCLRRFDVSNAAYLRPKPMDEPLRRSVLRCLQAAGVPVDDGDRNIQQIYRTATQANVARLGDCISHGMHDVHPEIEGLSWGPPDVY